MKSTANRRLSDSAEQGGKVLRPLAFQRSDTALIRSLRSGRSDATEQLFARYAQEVARLMVALLGPQAGLPDAIAEVFERLVREARRRDPGALSPKLLRLGVRVARQKAGRASWWQWRRGAGRQIERADISRDHRKLYQALGALDDEERVIYALHFVVGHPAQEVAAAVGLSLTAVRRHLKHLRQRVELGRPASDVGPVVAVEQAEWLERSDVIVQARERLLAPPTPRRVDTMVVLLILATAATLLTLWPRAPSPLGFSVGEDTPGAVRTWLTAPAGEQLPLRFDDGGEVRLLDGARARVMRADRQRGELVVERGTIHVEASGQARWTYVVGPFDVAAHDARFEARWLPSAERLDLAVGQGEVRVTGPDLDERVIGAGESLAVHATGGVIDAP